MNDALVSKSIKKLSSLTWAHGIPSISQVKLLAIGQYLDGWPVHIIYENGSYLKAPIFSILDR